MPPYNEGAFKFIVIQMLGVGGYCQYSLLLAPQSDMIAVQIINECHVAIFR